MDVIVGTFGRLFRFAIAAKQRASDAVLDILKDAKQKNWAQNQLWPDNSVDGGEI